MALDDKHCVPCKEGGEPLSNDREEELLKDMEGWKINREDEHSIQKTFEFDDFKGSIQFVNRVAEIANKEDHHPDISIRYSKVKITLLTHKIGGLHENDFIVAAKIDRLV